MFRSNSDHTSNIGDSLTLIEQAIKVFQAQKERILQFRKTKNSDSENNIFTLVVEDIEKGLKRLRSNDHEPGVRDSLILIFQTEISNVSQINKESKSNRKIDTSAYILKSIEDRLQQLDITRDYLNGALNGESDRKAFIEAEAELLKKRKAREIRNNQS
jgi:hypothetical protein